MAMTCGTRDATAAKDGCGATLSVRPHTHGAAMSSSLVTCIAADRSKVSRKSHEAVEIAREDGRSQTFRIVGEDEADPAAGSISYVSPMARALLGKSVGDSAVVNGAEVEVIAVRPSPGD